MDQASAEKIEIERLEARVAQLEAELAEQSRRTAALVAEAQQKLYWLDRWHVDLNAVMERPGALAVLNNLKRVRVTLRFVRRTKRRLLGS